MPLGTPFLMAAIDCYSGCIAGFDIGFDPPSYVSTARTLKHLIGFKDMEAFGTDEDGEPVIRNAYPMNGVPLQFILDNDQAFHSRSLFHSAAALGCHIDYIPPSQSWKKGRIERFWGTVQESYLDMFPGKVLRYGDDRARDYKPEDDAVITLGQLRLFVTKAIVDVHHQEVDEWTGERRIDLWTKSVAINPPRRVRAHDDLVELVGAYEERKAERRGIRLFGLRYNSSDLAKYRAGFEKDPRVEIRYDPENIEHVTLVDHAKGFTLRVPCTRPDYVKDLSLHQHLVIKRRAKDRSPEGLIRMAELTMAKAELFKLGQSMLKARKGRGRLTKVAQHLGVGREVIDLMSRRFEDVEQSAEPLDLSEDAVSDAEDDRDARTDESLVETFRDRSERKPRRKAESRTPRAKAEPAASPRRPDAALAAETPPTPVPPTPIRPTGVRRNMKVDYGD